MKIGDGPPLVLVLFGMQFVPKPFAVGKWFGIVWFVAVIS